MCGATSREPPSPPHWGARGLGRGRAAVLQVFEHRDGLVAWIPDLSEASVRETASEAPGDEKGSYGTSVTLHDGLVGCRVIERS